MDDHKKYLLNDLNARSRDNILSLMRCAARDPEGHEIRTGKSGVKNKPNSLEVVLPAGHSACPAVTEDWNLSYWLGDHGFLEIGHRGWQGPLRFRTEILQWFRETHQATDADIQEAIGRQFYELGTANEYDDALVPFDLAAIAGELGYPPERVQSNVRALARSGVLRNDGPGGAGVPPYYVLTELGFRWVRGGFKADFGLTPSVDVSVNLHVEIDQAIEVIAELPISDDQKRAYELIVRKLEGELNRGKLSWGTLRDAFGMLADGQAVAGTIFKVLADNKDAILQALSQMSRP
jgi:hypothetical protein